MKGEASLAINELECVKVAVVARVPLQIVKPRDNPRQ